MKRTDVSFTVSETQLEEIKRYAHIKGYHTAAGLARAATFAYMRRNPISSKELDKYREEHKISR